VTDVPKRQLIIAAGEGAKAAISVSDYLVEQELVVLKAYPTPGNNNMIRRLIYVRKIDSAV